MLAFSSPSRQPECVFIPMDSWEHPRFPPRELCVHATHSSIKLHWRLINVVCFMKRQLHVGIANEVQCHKPIPPVTAAWNIWRTVRNFRAHGGWWTRSRTRLNRFIQLRLPRDCIQGCGPWLRKYHHEASHTEADCWWPPHWMGCNYRGQEQSTVIKLQSFIVIILNGHKRAHCAWPHISRCTGCQRRERGCHRCGCWWVRGLFSNWNGPFGVN